MILETARTYPCSVAEAVKKLFFTAIMVFAFVFLTGCRNDCGEVDEDVYINNALEHFLALQKLDSNAFLRYNMISAGASYAPSGVSYLVPVSVDEFQAENVDCCRFSYRGAEGWIPSWKKRFSTDYAGFVTIKYKLRWIENNEIVEAVHKAEIPMNSCAEPIPLYKIRLGRFE